MKAPNIEGTELNGRLVPDNPLRKLLSGRRPIHHIVEGHFQELFADDAGGRRVFSAAKNVFI